ncbi:class I SAM-dependent DNA methyltransferase [Mesorhizobium sp. SP-1A]|uniref:class I SAM-dependent DNA methyltransferase n=1 Tax=Mesorhizobium sp. SP-1A TaxID=3077840 RepID=UPI0028F7490D|nr:N-6 DNA methylase [Mesorhizobium sp. SP-1A]
MKNNELTYSDLQKIVWMIADKIRDKGRGNSNDYMAITVGTIFLKRLMDMRAEFKYRFVEAGTNENSYYEMSGSDIDEVIENHQSLGDAFRVSPEGLWTYRIEWSDIANFATNENFLDLTIPYGDGLGGKDLQTNVANKFVLLRDCLEAFSNEKIHEIFSTFDFLPKIYGANNRENILDARDYEQIIEDLNQYNFGTKYASQDIFADVYMDLLGRFAADNGKKGGEFFTPTPVVRGAIPFLEAEFKERRIMVADLASGACTFMVEFGNHYRKLMDAAIPNDADRDVNSYLQFRTGEKDRTSHALGDANMLLHGHGDNHKSYHANSITEYEAHLGKETKGKVDVILANPPYGLKDYGHSEMSIEKSSRWLMGVPNKGDGEYAFLMTILDMLNDEGRAVVVMPLGTLFRDSTESYRKRIIENDWLKAIIELPKGMFLTTPIPVCLWVIDKKKKPDDQGKVVFINASQDFVKSGKINDWQPTNAVDAFLGRSDIDGYSRRVLSEEIARNKYNLTTGRYIQKNAIIENVDIKSTLAESNQLMKEITAEMNELGYVFRAMTGEA